MMSTPYQAWLLAGLIGLLISQFQNCAPPSTSPSLNSELDSEVRIVDDWTKVKVHLLHDQVEIFAGEETPPVDGFCARALYGKLVSWVMVAADGTEIDSGEAVCERGGFRVHALRSDLMECGTTYELIVVGHENERDSVPIAKHCSTQSD